MPSGLTTVVFTLHTGAFAFAVLVASVVCAVMTLFLFHRIDKSRRWAALLLTFVGVTSCVHYGVSHFLLDVSSLDVELIRLKQTADDGPIAPEKS